MSNVVGAVKNINESKGGNKKQPEPSKEVRKEFIESVTKPPPKPTRGRPKKNTTPAPTPPPQNKSAQDVINMAARKKLIKRLNALMYHFPEELGPILQNFDPHACSIEKLEQVCGSCEEMLSDNVEQTFYPVAMNRALGMIETGALSYAQYRPRSFIGVNAPNLIGLTEKLEKDEGIQRDIKILSARRAGTLPNNPYARICSSVVACIADCVQRKMGRYNGNQETEEDYPMNTTDL